jgi:hypothetical protein
VRREPGQGEAVLVWGLWALVALAALVTYSRLDPSLLYHTTGEGIGAGLSRVAVLLCFPISLVAIALTLLSLAALPRNAWWIGAPAIALCAVTALPGVVRQEDLDARWVNAVPAIGVALAVGLTSAAALVAGASLAPGRPADRLRVALGIAIAILSLPWIAAELGFHLPTDVFLGEEIPSGEALAAVHLGHHHGLDGALLVGSALLLSRRRPAGRSGTVYLAYVSLAFGYGAVNFAQDLWQEQLVKRGWVDWSIPAALEPGPRPVWLAILALSALALWSLAREQAILRR